MVAITWNVPADGSCMFTPHMIIPLLTLCRNGLPAGVVESLQDGDVSSTVDVAFAPGGGYVITYNPPCGRGPTLEAIGLDPTLKTWLFEKKADGDVARTFADVKISLGPKAGSYWATDGNGWIWGGLPEKLGEKVASIRNNTGGFAATPKIVTLGLGDDYIIMTETGSTVEISWSLTNYPETEANIKVILEMKRLGDLKVSGPVFLVAMWVLASTQLISLAGHCAESVQKGLVRLAHRRYSRCRRPSRQVPACPWEVGCRHQDRRSGGTARKTSCGEIYS